MTKNSRTIEVDQDGVLNLPDDLIAELGWKEGDTLLWIDNKDGSWTLKKDQQNSNVIVDSTK
jgi:bifunctional DNA-binding transcriptional regulator/antitoxin component of YhaV-PrlF toxin-antitoxin module